MAPDIDYTTLTLGEVSGGLDEVARQTEAEFGAFDIQQLNWRPDATSWSVGQCFEHLLTTTRAIRRFADDALDDARPRTVWQRLPVLPAIMGKMLIRSQAPTSVRKFTAPPAAQPAREIAADIIQRFVADVHETTAWLGALDGTRAAAAIMRSPFIAMVTYSVLDGCRVMMAHEHRHFEQARRITQSPAFPSA